MISIPPDVARRFLVNHLDLNQRHVGDVTSLLNRLHCIQLDPLDPMGTNADLVAMARLDGIGRGDDEPTIRDGGHHPVGARLVLLQAHRWQRVHPDGAHRQLTRYYGAHGYTQRRQREVSDPL